MKKRNPVRKPHTKENSAERTKYLMIAAVCGVVFIASLFFAARQHFSSIDYSIKNAKLRKQIEDLEYDKQRLKLNRELALFSNMKATRKLSESSAATLVANASTTAPAKTEIAKAVKPAVAERSTETAKLVQKTVQSVPLPESKKQEKKDPNTRERKVQIAAAGK